MATIESTISTSSEAFKANAEGMQALIERVRGYEQRITNIMIVDALSSGLPQVFADAHQIQQVLLNLIINAVQAMSPDGQAAAG